MAGPFDRGSASAPVFLQTPAAGSPYQVNVNRTKTRKWVEAKVQSYDGDDWGADEYGGHGDHDEPQRDPPPVLPSAQWHGSAPLPSSHPGHDAAAAVPGLSSSRQSSVVAPPRPPSTPPAEQSSSAIEASADRHGLVTPDSVRAPSSAIPSAQSADPAKKRWGSTSLPFTGMSDVSRHEKEEEKQGQRRSTDDPQPETSKDHLSQPGVTVRSDKQDPGGKDDAFHSGDSGTDVASIGERDARRDSISPQLPDVARMSAFGPDLFSVTGKDSSPRPAIPEHDILGLSSSSSTSLAKPTPAAGGHMPASAQENTLLLADLGEASDVQTQLLPLQKSWPAAQTTAPEGGRGTSHADDDAWLFGDPAKGSGELAGPHSAAGGLVRERAKTPELFAISRPDEEPTSAADAASGLAHPQARQPLSQRGIDWPAIPPLQTPTPSPRPSDDALKYTEFRHGSWNPYYPASPDGNSHPRPVQRKPTSSTASPSPVKDNDALSDEILRSLSPEANSSTNPTSGDGRRSLQTGTPAAARESSYTLRGYDSYWADAASGGAGPAPLAAAPLHGKASADSVAEASASGDGALADGADPRRRFSWEADGGEAAPQPAGPGSQPSTVRERTVTAESEARPEHEPAPPPADGGADVELSAVPDLAPGTLAEGAPTAAPDPPSPLSVAGDKQVTAGRDSRLLSLADDNALAQLAPSLSSPITLAESPATPASQPGAEPAQTRIMAFREVMGMPNVADRITKFNETRDHFASTDSGLDTWLAAIQAEYPEYASGPGALGAAAARLSAHGAGRPPSAGAQPPAQQPYYQQYLNASAPGASHAGRSRLGGLQMPLQATGSTFGHPSNQIGTKSKEFMHSAGKMGKGLLNKGKNKLRGDKGEASSPRNERRTSWGLSLGRFRPDGTAAAAAAGPASPTHPPQATEPAPVWQVDASQAHPRPHGLESSPKQQQSVRPRQVPGGPSKLEVAENGVTRASYADERARGAAPDATSDGWVVVPRQVASPGRDMPPDPCAPPDSLDEEDGGVTLRSQPPRPGREVPKRNSSFVGLPPIRRSSTFGLTTRAKRASRRFSLDDDDDGERPTTNGNNVDNAANGQRHRRPDPSTVGPAEPLSLVSSPVIMQVPGAVETMHRADDAAPNVVVAGREQPREAEARKPQTPQAAASGSSSTTPTTRDTSARLPMPASPIPGLLTGDWKLKESHLSEPLHSLTRRRSGAGNLQQHVFCDYERETVPAYQRPQGPYAAPPSSAHRYPELFSCPAPHDAPRPAPPRSRTWGQPEPRPYHAPPPWAETASLNRRNAEPGVGGVEVPGQDRGRSHHGRPGMAAASSAEQRPWSDRAQRSAAESHANTASESNTATEVTKEPRKRQSGFFLGLTGRSSMDPGSRQAQSIAPGGTPRPSTSSFTNDQCSAAESQVDLREARKRKRFSNMAAFSSLRDIFQGSGQERGSKSPTPKAGQHQYAAGPMGPPAVPFHGLDCNSTTSSVDALQPQPAREDSAERRRRRSSVSGMISDLLGRRPASKTGEPEGPRLMQPPPKPGAQQQQWHQHGSMAPPSTIGAIPHPGAGPRGSVGVFPGAAARADPADAAKAPPTVTVTQASQANGSQPRPSLLGHEAPIAHGNPAAEAAPQQSAQGPRAVQGPHADWDQARKAGAAAPTPRKAGGGLSLAGIGAQHDAGGGEADVPRSSTVSPDLSVTSDGQAAERAGGGGGQARARDGGGARLMLAGAAAQGAEPRGPYAEARHPQWSVSSDEASDHTAGAPLSGDRPLAGAGSAQGQCAVTSGPRDGRRDGESRPRPPPFTQPSHTHQLEQQHGQMQQQHGQMQQQHGQMQQQHGQIQQQHGQQQQQPGPQASGQTVDPRQAQQPRQHLPHGSEPAPSPRHAEQTEGQDSSGWKSLRHHASEQTAQNQGSKPGGGDRSSGLKMLGALKRMSEHPEPVRGPARQGWPGQEAQAQQRPHDRGWSVSAGQPPGCERAPQAWPRGSPPQAHDRGSGSRGSPPQAHSRGPGAADVAPGGAVSPLPSPQWGSAGAVSPLPSPQWGPAGGPGRGGEAAPVRRGPAVCEQVAAPRGCAVVGRGDGLSQGGFVPEHAARRGEQPSQGRFVPEHAAGDVGGWPKAWQSTSTTGQEDAVRHGSVSSLGQGPSSPPLESPEGGVAHQPSINSLATWPEARADGGEGEAPLGKSRLHQEHQHQHQHQQDQQQDQQRQQKDQQRRQRGEKAAAAELDDTAERYLRSRRLEAQEEKIAYKAEDAEDYQPQMSATSYPGQEWSPYGLMGAEDWRED